MATLRQCRTALNGLVTDVADADPVLRAKHIPDRTVLCRVRDLDAVFCARVDADGVHDLRQLKAGTPEPDADVRLTLDSDDLIALANRTEDFVTCWLKGRVHVSAPMRDMLRLRSLFGL